MYNAVIDAMSAIRRQRFGKGKLCLVFMGTPELIEMFHKGGEAK
jgi:hypothetical protein